MSEEFDTMKKEYEQRKQDMEKNLAQEFSFMRRRFSFEEQKASGRIHDLFGAYGCSTGSGWYEVLRSLCTEVTAAYERAGLPVDIIVDQVKEKFGKLRFYYHHEGHDPGIHAFDILGGPSFRTMHGNSELHQEVAKIVSKWENMSKSVCENCGTPGELRNDIGYRVQTLCDSCYTRIKQKIVELELKKNSKNKQ